MKYGLVNGTVLTGFPAKEGEKVEIIPRGAVVWEDERILAVGPETAIKSQFPEADYLNAHGGVILPGLVNLHTHCYSAMARGLNPGAPMVDFAAVLDQLWWRLDRALDEETVQISAELGMADAIRSGCTTLFDHHASPNHLRGSLNTIAEVAERAGLSALLCYEVTDRNGPKEAAAGLEENLRFLAERQNDPRIRGVLGLHASFTLREETLDRVARERPAETGIHIHLAEDALDARSSRRDFGASPLARLESRGLLDRRSLLAHGVHLDEKDLSLVAAREATLIHNPESNANNRVGLLDTGRAVEAGVHLGLGTDGMSGSMLRSLRAAFLGQRAHFRSADESSAATGYDSLTELLGSNVSVARRFFEEPHLGELRTGAPADLAVVDAPTITPLDENNLFAHLAFGWSEAPVRHTVARGRILLEDFQIISLDLERLAARARAAAPNLWDRFDTLNGGTPFLGEALTLEEPE